MNNELICVNAPFIEERHVEAINALCKKYDVPVKYTLEPDATVFYTNPMVTDFSVLTKLRFFQSAAAGVDSVLGDPIFRSRIEDGSLVLSSAAGCYGLTISEAITMMLLMFFRQGADYVRQSDVRGWTHLGEMRTLAGSTVTIVGTGDIGRTTAKRLRAFGVTRIRGVRRTVRAASDEDFDEFYPASEIKTALADTDIVILCAPGTSETSHMMDAEAFAACSPRAVIVNVGRGSAIDQDALLDAVRTGKIAGACLDVTVPEPLPADSPLWAEPNILIFPHVAGRTSAAATRDLLVARFLRNLETYLKCSGDLALAKPLMEAVVDPAKGY